MKVAQTPPAISTTSSTTSSRPTTSSDLRTQWHPRWSCTQDDPGMIGHGEGWFFARVPEQNGTTVLLLWLLQRPQLRYAPFPYPSVSHVKQWEDQAVSMTLQKPKAITHFHWQRGRVNKVYTTKNLLELGQIRNRVGFQFAFMEDVLLQGTLAARAMKGLFSAETGGHPGGSDRSSRSDSQGRRSGRGSAGGWPKAAARRVLPIRHLQQLRQKSSHRQRPHCRQLIDASTVRA